MKRLSQCTIVAVVLNTLLCGSAMAGSFYNQTAQSVTLLSDVDKGATLLTIGSGKAAVMPSTWGDKQLYVKVMQGGQVVCNTGPLSQYGVSKFGATDNVTITNSGCSVFTGTLPADSGGSSGGSGSGGGSSGGGSATADNANAGLAVLTNPREKGNGTWLYDAQFNDGPSGKAYTKAGLWLNEINNYNDSTSTLPGNRITQLFVYGGSLEMYCRGSGESNIGDACTSKNMLVTYYPPEFYNESLTLPKLGESGFHSSHYYDMGASKAVRIIPIVDGRVDNPAADDYLNAFNHMATAEANLFADNVARVYCADPRVAGVQFDIEPFDLNQPGQAAFYARIAMDFAGQNPQYDFGCKTAANGLFPNGRSFSVFTFPSVIQRNVDVAKTIFNKYQNGYVIYSAYDLPVDAPAGKIHSPAAYKTEVANLLAQAKSLAVNSGIMFQVAIPGAASVHEYESTGTFSNGTITNVKTTGYKQEDYISAALAAINESGVRSMNTFLGVDLWGWSKYMSYPPHSVNLYFPNQPTPAVLNVLGKF